ncbi:hypothetical protein AVEN_809-1, partial [Araneus ventricosus]
PPPHRCYPLERRDASEGKHFTSFAPRLSR